MKNPHPIRCLDITLPSRPVARIGLKGGGVQVRPKPLDLTRGRARGFCPTQKQLTVAGGGGGGGVQGPGTPGTPPATGLPSAFCLNIFF